MTDHRPECFALMCECDETHFESTDCHLVCICPSLRACEVRVMTRLSNVYETEIKRERNEALDAAREAVESSARREWINTQSAIAAIDALREDNDQRSQAEGVQL